MSKDFWNWLASLEAQADPRGDFIRDTRELLAAGSDPDEVIRRGDVSSEALVEYHQLCKQWGNN